MITIKTEEEIKTLAEGGKKLGGILREVAKAVRPGISTKDLDDLAERLILASGGEPSFKGYNPYGAKAAYPSALCVSVNDEVVHAIPHRKRILKEGDVVGLDIGMWYPARSAETQNPKLKIQRPMATDTAVTVGVGEISKTAEKLIRVTREALDLGIKEVCVGARIGDIVAAIQAHIERHGFGVVGDLAGHGVGYKVHEDPYVPNYGNRGEGLVLKEGMVLAIEPMATEGTYKVVLDKDEWCFRTADGRLAAHFEHTVAVTKHGCEVLTK